MDDYESSRVMWLRGKARKVAREERSSVTMFELDERKPDKEAEMRCSWCDSPIRDCKCTLRQVMGQPVKATITTTTLDEETRVAYNLLGQARALLEQVAEDRDVRPGLRVLAQEWLKGYERHGELLESWKTPQS